MSTDLTLHIPFHPAEVEDLILTSLSAKLAPVVAGQSDRILFGFYGEIVDGYAAKNTSSPWADDILGGRFSVPYYIYFGFPTDESSIRKPLILRLTSSILKVRTEDLLVTCNACPMLLRRNGVVTLSNGGYWTPAYLEALEISGPMRPLWRGDEGWEEPPPGVA